MGRGRLASHYAVMMDAADTFIIWRLILLIRDADSVSVWWMNAWRVYAGSGSSASLSWWPTIIRAVVNSGSDAAGQRSPASYRWELILRLSDLAAVFPLPWSLKSRGGTGCCFCN